MTMASRRRQITRGRKTSLGPRYGAASVAALLLICTNARAVPSATVIFSSGQAHVISPTGVPRPARSGMVVESGESIETGQGTVQLRMVDGALMALKEGTLLRMDDYHLASPVGNDERGYMSLVRGALRTISGTIGKARVDHYKLDTPSGTIGIRGTEYTAAVDAGLKVGVVNGRVAVCNDGGCVDVPKGSSAYTTDRSVKPIVAVRVSLVVPPANAGPGSSALVVAVDPDSSSVSTRPTAGDKISQFLTAALTMTPPTGVASSTSNTSDELPHLPGAATASTGNVSSSGSVGGPALVQVAPSPASLTTNSDTPIGGSTATSPQSTPSTPTVPAATMTPAPSTSIATPAPPPGDVIPAPAPPPAPAPTATVPGPAPAPTPVTAPVTATVPPTSPTTVALPSGAVTLGLVWATDKGELGSGLTQGTATFDATGALTALDDLVKNKKVLDKGAPVDAISDGIIAWGRWVDGQSKVNDANGSGKGNLATLHYFAFASSASLPVVGTFASFGSTAPTVQSKGNLVATGTLNSATGTLTTAFLTTAGGTGAYTLKVPVPGQTFTLAGVARQTSAFGFSGISLISSTGQACFAGCTGSLGGNVSVIGLIGGTQGNRAGITYGFDSAIGNVSGVVVFKR